MPRGNDESRKRACSSMRYRPEQRRFSARAIRQRGGVAQKCDASMPAPLFPEVVDTIRRTGLLACDDVAASSLGQPSRCRPIRPDHQWLFQSTRCSPSLTVAGTAPASRYPRNGIGPDSLQSVKKVSPDCVRRTIYKELRPSYRAATRCVKNFMHIHIVCCSHVSYLSALVARASFKSLLVHSSPDWPASPFLSCRGTPGGRHDDGESI